VSLAELGLRAPGDAEEDVDRLVADRQPPPLLEAERLVEGDRAVGVGVAVGVDQLHCSSWYIPQLASGYRVALLFARRGEER
jgi:hypothetical protein